jgi:hypothetical protein
VPPLATIVWTDLSEQGTWILQRIALPISLGHSPAEVAVQNGLTIKQVEKARAQLRDELERLA